MNFYFNKYFIFKCVCNVSVFECSGVVYAVRVCNLCPLYFVGHNCDTTICKSVKIYHFYLEQNIMLINTQSNWITFAIIFRVFSNHTNKNTFSILISSNFFSFSMISVYTFLIRRFNSNVILFLIE